MGMFPSAARLTSKRVVLNQAAFPPRKWVEADEFAHHAQFSEKSPAMTIDPESNSTKMWTDQSVRQS